MKGVIIKKILDTNKIKYKETVKSFIISKEKEMSKSKAPEWFQSFEKRFQTFESKFQKLEDKFDEHVAEFKEFKGLLLSLPTIKKEIADLKK